MIFMSGAILLAAAVQPVEGFAEWTKCWTDLEEGEIIMNHPIQRRPAQYPNSDGSSGEDEYNEQRKRTEKPTIRLIAMDGSTGKIVSPTSDDDDGNEYEVEYEPGDVFRIQIYPNTNDVTYIEYDDYYYSDDEENKQEEDDDARGYELPVVPANMQWVAETTAGGTFTTISGGGGNGGSSTCDGTRAVGRNRDSVVRLHLSGEESVVRVWAGYADDRVAVILTPELVFRRIAAPPARRRARCYYIQ